MVAAVLLAGVAAFGVSAALAGDGKHPARMLAQSAEDIANEVAQLEALLAGLSSDNRLVRIATYRAIMERGDALATSFAVEAAMDGPDSDLKTMALRDWLRMRERLNVELVPPDRASDAQMALYESSLPFWFRIEAVGDDEVVLRLQDGGSHNRVFRGSWIQGGFFTTSPGCTLELRVVDSRQLLGAYGCQTTQPIPAVVEIR